MPESELKMAFATLVAGRVGDSFPEPFEHETGRRSTLGCNDPEIHVRTAPRFTQPLVGDPTLKSRRILWQPRKVLVHGRSPAANTVRPPVRLSRAPCVERKRVRSARVRAGKAVL